MAVLVYHAEFPWATRWVPRDLAVLHAVGLPDHVDPAARSRVGRDDRAAGVLGAPLPPAAARCVPRVRRRRPLRGDGRDRAAALGSSPPSARLDPAGRQLVLRVQRTVVRAAVHGAVTRAALLVVVDRRAVLRVHAARAPRPAAMGAIAEGHRRGVRPRRRRVVGADVRAVRAGREPRPPLLRHGHSRRRAPRRLRARCGRCTQSRCRPHARRGAAAR